MGAALAVVSRRPRWATAVSLLVVVLVLVSLVPDLAGIDPGPVHLAIATAVALLAAALAVLLLAGARHRPGAGRLARGLAVLVAIIGVVVVLSRLLHVVALSSWYPFGAVAPWMALALIALGLAALTLTVRVWPAGQVSD